MRVGSPGPSSISVTRSQTLARPALTSANQSSCGTTLATNRPTPGRNTLTTRQNASTTPRATSLIRYPNHNDPQRRHPEGSPKMPMGNLQAPRLALRLCPSPHSPLQESRIRTNRERQHLPTLPTLPALPGTDLLLSQPHHQQNKAPPLQQAVRRMGPIHHSAWPWRQRWPPSLKEPKVR